MLLRLLAPCLAIACVSAQTVLPLALAPNAPLTGTFDKAPVPTDTVVSEGVAIADVDVDGRCDLLVGALLASSATANGMRYYRNRGDGTFEDRSQSHTAKGPVGIKRFVLADIDGDGDVDVVGTWSVLRNVQGVLRQEQLPPTPSNAVCVAAGDIDGDGDVDLFSGVGFGGGPPQQDRLLINVGGGVFQFAPVGWLPPDNDTTNDACFSDVDGDGDLDLVLAIDETSTGTGGARLYLNGGTGTFTNGSAALPVVPQEVLCVAAGDFDLDGDQDVVLGTGPNFSGVQRPDLLLRNLGNGQFVDASSALPGVLAPTSDVVAADLDADGDADLLLAEGGSSYALQRVYRNDLTAFTDVTAAWLPTGPLRGAFWATGSLDGDTHVDAALVTGYSGSIWPGRVHVFLNRVGASFQLLNPTRSVDGLPATAQVGEGSYVDFDGDGDLDWFAPVGLPEQILLVNDGQARLRSAGATMLPSAGLSGAALARVADVDGDGDPDLLLGSSAGIVQWRNDGTGHFTVAPTGSMPASVTNITAMCVGDVDNDGDVDVFGGRGSVSTFDELLRNDGTGVFTRDTTALPTHSNAGVKTCAMVDFDGDADLDLVLALGLSFSTGTLTVYRNTAGGQFVVATGVAPALTSVGRVQPFDADGDGDVDLFVTGSPSMTILLDQGASFAAAQPAGLATLLASSSEPNLFDLEGDGDLDVAVRLAGFGTQRVLRNDGAFQFVEEPHNLVDVSVPNRFGGADLDGDGDADFVLIASTREPAVVVGRRMQLYAPWLARVGLPYELQLHYVLGAVGAVSSATFVLNTNHLVPPIPLPPYGLLSVDPVGAVLGVGTVPALPTADRPVGLTCSLVLPGSPSLLGATLYSQALVLGASFASVTNLVADVIQP